MKKTRNMNKKGISLLESVLAVAIILVMSSAVMVGAVEMRDYSKASAKRTETHVAMYDAATSHVEGMLKASGTELNAWPGMDDGSESAYTPSAGTSGGSFSTGGGISGGGLTGDTEDPIPTTAPTATPIPTTAPTATPVPTVAPTVAPTTAPTQAPVPTTAPAGGTVSNIQFDGTFKTRGTPGNNVLGITDNGDGSQDIYLCYKQWNDAHLTVWNNGDGTYAVRMETDNTYYINDILGNYNHGGKTKFTLTNQEKTKIENAYGFKFG